MAAVRNERGSEGDRNERGSEGERNESKERESV
jgi:hypothetical protein